MATSYRRVAGVFVVCMAWFGVCAPALALFEDHPIKRASEEFESNNCASIALQGQSTTCTVCGKEFVTKGSGSDSGGTTFTWGGVEFAWGQESIMDGLVYAYCAGQGTLTATASPAGVQLSDMTRIFSDLILTNRPDAAPSATDDGAASHSSTSLGGTAEIGSTSKRVSGGLSIPFAYATPLGPGVLELPFVLGLGFSKDAQQIALGGRPAYRWKHAFVSADPAATGFGAVKWTLTLAGGLPFHMIGTFFEDEQGFGMNLGPSLLAATVGSLGKWSWGVGASWETRFEIDGAITMPYFLAGMGSYDLGLVSLMAQLGWSADVYAPKVDQADFLIVSAGVRWLDWLFGYQGYFLNDYMANGFGVTYVGKLF